MKKIYFIILVLFMLTGCENTKNVNNQVNQEVQTNKATLVCNNEYAGDTLKIATKLSKLSDFGIKPTELKISALVLNDEPIIHKRG